VALCLEEGEQHPAADEDLVDPRKQMRDDAELVADLRASEHDCVGTLRILGQTVQHIELGCDQQTGSGRQQLGEFVDARLLAVHHPEPVGDEHVAELRELCREGRTRRLILRGLPRVEPQVLDDDDSTVLERLDGIRRRLADRVACERDRGAEEFGEALRHRLQAVLRVGRAVRASEVGAHDDAGARVDQCVEGRQRGADTAIVRDDPIPQGDVEITTDDDTLALERPQSVQGAQSHVSEFRGARPRTRSGRPDGWSNPTRCRTSWTP